MTPLLRRAAPQAGSALHLTWNGQPIAAQHGDTVLTALLGALLRRAGCDRLQGFYFSKPMPIADLLQRRQQQG